MEHYKVQINVEPTNEYEKAKLDLITAMKSIRALPPYQQEQLAKEIFGAQAVAELVRIMQQYRG